MAQVVRNWATVATQRGARPAEIMRMASASSMMIWPRHCICDHKWDSPDVRMRLSERQLWSEAVVQRPSFRHRRTTKSGPAVDWQVSGTSTPRADVRSGSCGPAKTQERAFISPGQLSNAGCAAGPRPDARADAHTEGAPLADPSATRIIPGELYSRPVSWSPLHPHPFALCSKKGVRVAFQILSLSGGGFLGLYTAAMLAELEERSGKPLNQCFDLIAGTSIGGIIALGLAAGRSGSPPGARPATSAMPSSNMGHASFPAPSRRRRPPRSSDSRATCPSRSTAPLRCATRSSRSSARTPACQTWSGLS